LIDAVVAARPILPDIGKTFAFHVRQLGLALDGSRFCGMRRGWKASLLGEIHDRVIL
jgi:hypothetical protein